MPGVGPEGSSTSVREGRCIMTVRFTTVETANRVGRKNSWLGKGWSWSRSCSWSPVGDPAGDLAALDEVGGPAGRDRGGGQRRRQRRGRGAAYGRPVGGAAAPTSVRPSSGRRLRRWLRRWLRAQAGLRGPTTPGGHTLTTRAVSGACVALVVGRRRAGSASPLQEEPPRHSEQTGGSPRTRRASSSTP